MERLARHFAARLPRLRWRLLQWQQALGFWGLLAMGVMLATLLIELTLIGPGLRQDALRRAQVNAGIAERPQDVHVTEPAAVDKLPDAHAFAARLESLLGVLQQQGFNIEQTTLAYSTPGDSSLQRLEIDLPLNGTYPALRQALARVIEQPAVRIDSLVVERKDIDVAHLNISLKLSLLGVIE